jgi:hypothetical protein
MMAAAVVIIGAMTDTTKDTQEPEFSYSTPRTSLTDDGGCGRHHRRHDLHPLNPDPPRLRWRRSWFVAPCSPSVSV